MDSAREAALAAVEKLHADLKRAGAIGPIWDLIGDVWAQNIDRHEPESHGDTARSLGQLCSENIKTLALRRYHHDDLETPDNHWKIPGLRAELIGNVLILFLGDRQIMFMKAPPNLGRRPDLSRFAKWSTQSEIRLDVATENTYALNCIRADDLNQLTMADNPYDPTKVRNFIVVWAGEEDSPKTGAHLTVPILGSPAFAAQVELWYDKDDEVRLRPHADLPQSGGFDTQPAVEPAITLKPRPGSEGQA